MNGWELYNAKVAADTAHHRAEKLYARAVEIHGPQPESSLPECYDAQVADHEADRAWEKYADAWHDVQQSRHPERYAEAEPS